jgi:hypothetical protein
MLAPGVLLLERIPAMRHFLSSLILPVALAASACDGPRENAGEKADAAAGAVTSEDTLRSGPAEEMGARQDAAAEGRADAKEAEADSIEASAAETREAARQRAKALRKEADAARKAPADPPPPRKDADINGM